MKAHLVLVRHGTSTWNKLGLWTGHTDIELAPEGVAEAKALAELIRDIPLSKAHTSTLKRAKETLGHILSILEKPINTTEHPALNERHYGIHTGKNKWEVKQAVGDEVFHKIRRSWDFDIPEGESLKQVYERVVPYFQNTIHPDLTKGINIIISAHGNSLRALKKYLDNIPDDKIGELEFNHDEAHCYEFENGQVIACEVRRLPRT